MARPTGRPIREELIDTACTMVQRVGVNSFSYGDLAEQLGISAPSIHHHFRTKDELIAEVAARYREDFATSRDSVDEPSAAGRIRGYAHLFSAASSRDLLCFCGSVASDWFSVGERARAEVLQFFDEQVEWLAHQLGTGAASGEFTLEAPPRDGALALLAALEGSLLLSRAGEDTRLPDTVVATLLGSFLR